MSTIKDVNVKESISNKANLEELKNGDEHMNGDKGPPVDRDYDALVNNLTD